MSVLGFRSDWESENPGRCQRLVDRLSDGQLVAIGARSLEICAEVIAASADVIAVVALSRDRARWKEGHDAFDRVRDAVLRLPDGHHTDPAAVLLYAAENTARVIYNSTLPNDPFDQDSRAWLLVTLAQSCHAANAPGLTERVWHVIDAGLNARFIRG